MSRGGAKSAQKIGLAERREQAWELRKQGHDFRSIAAKLGYSKSSAERDIKHVMETLINRTVESAADARTIDLARLDDLLAAWFATALREHERPTAGQDGEGQDDLVAAWFALAVKTAAEGSETAEAGGAASATPLDDVDWSKLSPLDLLEAVLKRAQLSRQATEIVLKIFEQRAKLLGLYRQEVALTTPAPLQMGVDLTGLDEESLNAIIRNLTAALGAGAD